MQKWKLYVKFETSLGWTLFFAGGDFYNKKIKKINLHWRIISIIKIFNHQHTADSFAHFPTKKKQHHEQSSVLQTLSKHQKIIHEMAHKKQVLQRLLQKVGVISYCEITPIF